MAPLAKLPLQASLFSSPQQQPAIEKERRARTIPASPPQRSHTDNTLWAALFLPRLAAQVVRDDGEAPWVVVHEVRGQQQVYLASLSAEAFGIAPGMALTAAYALCPELETEWRDEEAERAGLVQLADWAGQFTSIVSLEPQALLLEIGGSLALFGGLNALQARIKQGMQGELYSSCLAIAPTPQAALLFARGGVEIVVKEKPSLRAVLGELPLDLLPVTEKQALLFRKLGLSCLRDLWRLPGDGLAKRFGVDLVEYLERLLGQLPEPRLAHQGKARFSACWPFPIETDNMLFIYHGLEQLLPRLIQFMRLRELALNRLQVVFYHAQCSATRIELGMQQLSCNEEHILTLLHERLEQLQLTAPILEVEIVADEFHHFASGNESLFEDGSEQSGEWQQMLDQLQVRMGTQTVGSLQLLDDHRPGFDFEWTANESIESESVSRNERPLWLISPPELLPQGLTHITLLSEPERIEGGWWEGQDIRRDYYQAQDTLGRRVWLFHDLNNAQWYLHGLFA